MANASQALYYIDGTLTDAKRVWINYEDENIVSLNEIFSELNRNACWGGADHKHVCLDSSITISWEIPPENITTVEELLKGSSLKKSDFWKINSKN